MKRRILNFGFLILWLFAVCRPAYGGSYVINAFNSGELSPLIDGRTDLAKYYSGASTVENLLVLTYGGVQKRTGTKYIAEARDSASGLLRFEFSADDAYIIEAGNLYMRFYTDGGQIQSDGNPYALVTPYLAEHVAAIQYIQSADTMYLAHANYAPRTLTRTADTAWTLDLLDFEGGPFLGENETDTTITATATTGSITLTASSPVFNENHVGALWRLTHTVDANQETDSFSTGAAETSSSITVQLGRSYSFSTHGTWSGTIFLQRSYDSGSNWKDVRPVHYEDDGNISLSGPDATENVDDAIYRVHKATDGISSGTCNWSFIAKSFDVDGIVDITAFTDVNTVTGTVEHTLGAAAATALWAEGAWSPDEGYPGALAFYQERLVMGGTTNSPQTLWLSQTDDWPNFLAGDLATSALSFTLASDQVNVIRWLGAQQALLIGTAGAEWKLAPAEAGALSPENLPQVAIQTSNGSADIQPVSYNNAVVYAERQARRVREMSYSFTNDSWVSPDLTALSEHITEGGITQMALQKTPDPIVWCTREDGQLLGMTYKREQDVVGWHRHIFEGPEVSAEASAAATQAGLFVLNNQGTSAWFGVKLTLDGAVDDDWGDSGAILNPHGANLLATCNSYLHSKIDGKLYITHVSNDIDQEYHCGDISSSTGTVVTGDVLTGGTNGGTYTLHDIFYDTNESYIGRYVVTILTGTDSPAHSEVLSKTGASITVAATLTTKDVTKYNSDGSIDTTWGDAGYKEMREGTANFIVEDSHGNTYVLASSTGAITKLDADGSFEWVASHLTGSGVYFSNPYSAVLSHNESVLYIVGFRTYLGNVIGATTTYLAQAIKTSDGTPDTSWGTDGRLMIGTDFSSDTAAAWNIQRKFETNELYITYHPQLNGGKRYSVVKLTADGAIDTDWGTDGFNGDALYATQGPVTYSRHHSCMGDDGLLWVLSYDNTGGSRDTYHLHIKCYDDDGDEEHAWEITDANVAGMAWTIRVKGESVYLAGNLRTQGGIRSRIHRYDHDGVIDTTYTPAEFMVGGSYLGDPTSISRDDDPEDVWRRNEFGLTDGVESVAVIPGDGEDEVWLLVQRTIEGLPVKYIEQMQPRQWTDVQDAFYVDCGLSFDGGEDITITGISQADPGVVTAADHGFSDGDQVRIEDVAGMTELNNRVFSVGAVGTDDTFEIRDATDSVDWDTTIATAYTSGGTVRQVENNFTTLDHLEGETVTIVGDGGLYGTETVASNTITLDDYFNTVHAGLGFDSTLVTMRLDVPGQLLQGRTKRINEITIRFFETQAAKFGWSATDLDAVVFRDAGDPLEAATPLFSGDKREQFGGDYQTDARIWLIAEDPLPFTVTAIIPYFEVYE